ncbi:MAG: hypothetical protein RL329_1620 [Bacteroidota bacterium]
MAVNDLNEPFTSFKGTIFAFLSVTKRVNRKNGAKVTFFFLFVLWNEFFFKKKPLKKGIFFSEKKSINLHRVCLRTAFQNLQCLSYTKTFLNEK